MRELFIYYRVNSADATAALSTVRALQARLVEAHPHLIARVLRRPEVSADGWQTWMETYAVLPRPARGGSAHSGDGVTPAIEADIARQSEALSPHIVGSRHIEVFVACA